jgi:hypothetical protein
MTVTRPLQERLYAGVWQFDAAESEPGTSHWSYVSGASLVVNAGADTLTLRGVVPGLSPVSRLWFRTADFFAGDDRPEPAA